jgi:cell wall-associated NlpC family hydrolase
MKYMPRGRPAPDNAETTPEAKATAEAKKVMRKKTRLRFEKQAQGSKLRPAPLTRPAQEVGLAAHGGVSNAEDDNAAVEGAHKTELAAERTAGYAVHKARTSSKRTAGKQEKAAAGSRSKQYQKRSVKRKYAKDLRDSRIKGGAKKAATAKSAAAKTAERSKKIASFIARHSKGLIIAGVVILIIVLLFAALSSCSNMIAGGFNSIIGSSYTSEDEDITEVDDDYSKLEAGLNSRIGRIETDYPGYDEYRYNLDEIGHDPFELASYLTAKLQSYTPATAAGELNALFGRQYTLTLSPVTEVRYRTEQRTGYRDEQHTEIRAEKDPKTGKINMVEHTYTVTVPYTYTVEVPYNYYILNVALKNKSIGGVAAAGLNAEQQEMYAVYMQTRGNKDYLFEGNVYVDHSGGAYTDYDIPPDALTDTRFAAMIREAEKYLGYPYVWGGSSPATSFDCSGFVSWVINHSGGSVGRQTAGGLFNLCAKVPPSEAKPGDLIFFTKTYNSGGAVSHVGIYVGGGMMIHCGSPISYANVGSSYWQQHFYAYGRLP